MANTYFIFALMPETDMTPEQIADIPPVKQAMIQQRMAEISKAIPVLVEDTAEFAQIIAEGLAQQFPGVHFCVGQTIHTVIVPS